MNTKGMIGIIVGAIAILVVVVIGLFALKIISIPVKTVTKQVDAASDIVDQTYTAQNAIYNYESHQPLIKIRGLSPDEAARKS